MNNLEVTILNTNPSETKLHSTSDLSNLTHLSTTQLAEILRRDMKVYGFTAAAMMLNVQQVLKCVKSTLSQGQLWNVDNI